MYFLYIFIYYIYYMFDYIYCLFYLDLISYFFYINLITCHYYAYMNVFILVHLSVFDFASENFALVCFTLMMVAGVLKNYVL